jgi:hypothetical protein
VRAPQSWLKISRASQCCNGCIAIEAACLPVIEQLGIYPQKPPNGIDLMEALKASLAAAKAHRRRAG